MRKPGQPLFPSPMRIDRITLSPFETNTYLIRKGGKVLVIDPGDEGKRLGEEIGEEVTLIIATHGHLDHLNGVNNLRKKYPAPFYLHEKDLYLLENSSQLDWKGFFVDQQEVARPTHLFKREKEVLEWEGERLEIYNLPGHSPGSVVVKIGGNLFTGDLIFRGSVGRWDLPGGDEKILLASLKKIMEWEENLTLYPGHGPPTTLQEERRTNPFLLSLG